MLLQHGVPHIPMAACNSKIDGTWQTATQTLPRERSQATPGLLRARAVGHPDRHHSVPKYSRSYSGRHRLSAMGSQLGANRIHMSMLTRRSQKYALPNLFAAAWRDEALARLCYVRVPAVVCRDCQDALRPQQQCHRLQMERRKVIGHSCPPADLAA